MKKNENSVTRTWKVFGRDGHRQRESFCRSFKKDFSDWRRTRIIEVLNSDVTGTNEYSIISITSDSPYDCLRELDGQIFDGIFENSRCGKVLEVVDGVDVDPGYYVY